MKLALWMSCATALRVTPTMVQQPRRAVLAGGAAAAGSLILPAHAKKPLCLPGTNSAKALGGPGYTIGILEHDTPSFAKWHKVLEGFGSDLLSGYPSECKIIDQFFIKSRSTETGKDAVLSGIVFETSGLKAVKKFYDNGRAPNFEQGRKDGWLTGKWRENYFACSDFRGPTPGPPPIFQKGWGISFGAHGLGVSYKDWLKAFGSPEIDALHESLNIQYSVCGPVNGKVSTDLDGGVGVLHVHKSFKDTQKFDAAFQGVKAQITKDGIYKEPSRFVYGEVMNTSDDFIKAGSVVDLKA